MVQTYIGLRKSQRNPRPRKKPNRKGKTTIHVGKAKE